MDPMSDPIDDLDRLVSELETLREGPPLGPSRLDAWLRLVADRGASDLLLLAGEPPALRIEGRIVRSDGARLDGADIEDIVRANHAEDFEQALSALPPSSS